MINDEIQNMKNGVQEEYKRTMEQMEMVEKKLIAGTGALLALDELKKGFIGKFMRSRISTLKMEVQSEQNKAESEKKKLEAKKAASEGAHMVLGELEKRLEKLGGE